MSDMVVRHEPSPDRFLGGRILEIAGDGPPDRILGAPYTGIDPVAAGLDRDILGAPRGAIDLLVTMLHTTRPARPRGYR